ncbi:MAG: MexH family multidrug efflux RND transporter periplasmic adaptor subunit [marine bacterium B5-7]|nr:MAG: MexH family multidrug efflux RND transporter periplasmic adaptor subunit [marine bacterium B5-7]
MKKRMLIMIIFLAILFGGIFSYDAFRAHMMKQYFANFHMPAQTISTTVAKNVTWDNRIPAVGTLVAVNGVNVNPQVEGQIVKITFKSGQIVPQGKPLVMLDSRLDQADLANYQAQLTLAKIDYERNAKLLKSSAASQSTVDTSMATLRETQAKVDYYKTLVDYKTIRAPFDGKMGLMSANVGQYLRKGDSIGSLQALDPLYVNFGLPEQDVSRVKVGNKVALTTDAFPKQVFKGQVNAINALVDQTTRNIKVQAKIPNPMRVLYPGMFVNVSLQLPNSQNFLTVPQTAVAYSLYGNSVYKVVDDPKTKQKIAKQVFVKLGEQRGLDVAILKGIAAGDVVVTSGQLKLHNGSPVAINNSIKLNSTSLPNG